MSNSNVLEPGDKILIRYLLQPPAEAIVIRMIDKNWALVREQRAGFDKPVEYQAYAKWCEKL